MSKFRFYLVAVITLIMVLAVHQSALAQRMRIQMNAGELRHTGSMGDMTRALNNPVFEHEGAYLYCDSAWLYETTNTMDCFGHVRIKSSDTLNLYGKFLHYDGNAKMATVKDDVKLVDKQTTLTTDLMIFDRNTGIASYTTGGKMVNGDNILTSKRCFYHTNEKLMFFRDDVVLTNPDYKINCDTLKYNTVSRISYFLGPTILKGKDNYLYCEDGEYDRVTGKSRFSLNALLVDNNRRLTGDSLYYNERTKYGKAVNHVVMTDTSQHVIIKGNFAEYWRTKGYSLFTNEAVALMGDKKDTLYLHADTLKATFDTTKNESKDMFAYHNTRFFRKDLQGACDSLNYSFADSLIYMYKYPVLWADKNQLSADTIKIMTGKNSIKQIFMYSTAFIVSKDTVENFNQIRGKNMIGHFVDNELTSIDVNGNAETVYFVREDNKSLMGVNKAAGSRMRLYVVDNKIERIVYFDKPAGNMFPSKSVTPEQRKLKGFNWRFVARPLNRDDIFRKVDLQPEAPKKESLEPNITKNTAETNNVPALNETKVANPIMVSESNEKNVQVAAAITTVKEVTPVTEVKHANTMKQTTVNNEVKNEETAVVKKKEETAVVIKKEEPVVVKANLVESKNATDTTTLRVITYSVQIFVLSKAKSLADDKFKGLNDVQMYIEDDKYKYTAGIFSTREEAITYRNVLLREGFGDAFVITMANGKRIYK